MGGSSNDGNLCLTIGHDNRRPTKRSGPGEGTSRRVATNRLEHHCTDVAACFEVLVRSGSGQRENVPLAGTG